MVLRKLSQSFRITLALMLAVLSTGLLQAAPVFAIAAAVGDSYTIDENSTEDFDVTSNDTGSHKNNLSVTSVTDPANGTTSIHRNGKVTYTPDTDYVGSDSFSYTLTDSADSTTSVATVSVTVEEEDVIEQTCDDVTTPGTDGWTTKFNDPAGYPDTVEYTAPSGFVVDKYCVKAGSTAQGNGPIIVPVIPATSTVTIDYPNKDSISHYVVHLVQVQSTTQTLVSPVAADVDDICGTSGDTVTEPEDSVQITYTRDGNVVTATLVNPTTHDFDSTALNGYVVAIDGLTATFTASFPNDEPCLTATPCPTPENGGVITQNSGWTIAGGEFVDGGVEFTSNNWSASYIGVEMEYMISQALQLGWTVDGSVSGAGGSAIIFVTATGANIHYEPEPYTDDFWTNTPGILPVSGGGQGGTYSGSLQDLLDMGDQTIAETYFYFNSATENTVTLKSLSFNCTTYTFNTAVLGENDEKVTICHATSSASNPYEKITVAKSAVDGGTDNGDHYNEHTGPIFDPTTNKSGDKWGDIIPPVAGSHEGLNWTTQGQAIYNNGDCVVTGEDQGMSFTTVCVANGVKVTLTNSGDTAASATVNGTVYQVPANDSLEVVLAYDLGTPFKTKVVVTVGTTTATQTVNCVPGGQGGGNVLGSQTGGGQGGGNVLGAATNAVLPAMLPSTGAKDSPFMILAAALLAYGAAYFLQGRRLLGRKEALTA